MFAKTLANRFCNPNSLMSALRSRADLAFPEQAGYPVEADCSPSPYRASQPPSIASVWPVTMEDAGLAR
mgnify:CR=1 FL=1